MSHSRRCAAKVAPLALSLALSPAPPLALLFVARPAVAQGEDAPVRALDRSDVIALAREQAPAVLNALAQVQDARARTVGAGLLSTRNPTLEGSAGPRFGAEGTTPQMDVSAWLPLPLVVDRARSLAAAEAHVESARDDVEVARQQAVGVALDAYVHVLHARERAALARERTGLADRLLSAAKARLDAGDASRLEVELAQAERAASLAAVLAAEAGLASAASDLAGALGLSDLSPSAVHGRLADEMTFSDADALALEPLLARALEERADLRAAASGLDAARADVERAALGWLPELSLGASYGYEEGAHITTAAASISLPVFDAGQGPHAEAAAIRDRRARELEQLRRVARAEVRGAFAVHDKALAAARLLQAEALPRVAAAQELVSASYAAGKIDLADLLVVRREALAIRAEHLTRQRDAALAANRLRAVVGPLPTVATVPPSLRREP